MSLGTTNRDGGKTSESGHLRSIYKALLGEVLSGLAVSQRGAGANMSVDIAVGDAVLPRSDGTYGHPVFNDATLNKTVTTADPSNPRRDIVIMYLDYTVTPSTGVSNNTNGVVLTKVVAGTPAGSPADPSAAALQAAAGSGNPYIKLARIRVGAGVTSIGNSVIDDLRKMANGVIQGGWIYDSVNDWTYASSLSFTVAGVNVTSQFPQGAKIALYQGGTIKYFVVDTSTFSTNTTVTLKSAGGTTSYTLTNVPIDKPAYSYSATPVGFPGVIRRVPIAIQGDGGTATNTHIEGAPEVSISGTNSDFFRGHGSVPQDYVPGTTARIIIHMRTTNAQTKGGTYYIGARGPNAAWSIWNVANGLTKSDVNYTTAMLEVPLDTAIPAANLAAGGTVAFAFGVMGAVTGTIFAVTAELEYTAYS